MKHFNYKTALKFYAEEAVAALAWCKREEVCVNADNKEVDWLKRTPEDKWKPLWRVLEYYPYTTVTYVDHKKETSEFNFCVGDDDETRGLARLLWEVWFGYVDRKYHKRDNKTALKLQNRLTGKIIYMGWYDNRFTVTEKPANMIDSWISSVEINED